MGDDEAALLRLWREKRGEVEPEDLSDNLIVQLGTVTEELNRRWYERNTGHVVKDVQRRVQHPVNRWMAATLDGLVEPGRGVRSQIHAALDVLGGSRRRKAHGAAAAQYVGDECPIGGAVDHHRRRQMGRNRPSMPIRCTSTCCSPPRRSSGAASMSGETPRLFGVEPPRPRLEAVRIVDMSASNSWAEFAAIFRRTRPAFQEHEGAKADLKKLVPEDAKEAIGHGLRAKRSKSGAISFRPPGMEAGHAPLQ